MVGTHDGLKTKYFLVTVLVAVVFPKLISANPRHTFVFWPSFASYKAYNHSPSKPSFNLNVERAHVEEPQYLLKK